MARKAKERTLSGTIEFYSDPFIYYNGEYYVLGETINVTPRDSFSLRAKVRCTYTQVSQISVTVRLLINSREVCRWFGSIPCKDQTTKIPPISCTPTESGRAEVELWLGDPDRPGTYPPELKETRSSWTINVKKACSVSTNKDTYYQGDTVTITYENAPSNSTLSIGAYPNGIPGKSWTVSGNGSILYTIPDDAPTGTWYVYLSDTNCSKTKYITVLASKSPTDLICKDPNKSATVGDTVDLEVELEDKATGVGIDGKWINFYKLVDSTEVSIGSCSTDPNGKCSITYTCSVEETATIKAKFRGNDDYKASECTFTITVSSKPTCNQSFRVVDEDTGARVPQSVVIVREKGTAKELGRCTTDSNGECTVEDIEEGVWCVAEASAPSGYEVISDSSTEFVACTSLKTLKLRSTTCKQRVKVIDPVGNPIEGATVAIDMGTYSILCKKPDGSGYGTDAKGECDLCNLKKGTVYTACASKEGYESYGSESCKLFQACSPLALILKLQKIPPAKLEIVEAFYSIDNGITFWGLKENSTIDLGDCKRPLFKLIVKNTGGLPSYRRCLWLRKGTGCSSGSTVGIETSTTTLNKGELETIFLSCDVDMEYGKDYSFHIKNGQIIQGCPSDDEFDFKTETRRPYEIRITVKDEQGHGIKHAYVSVTKEIFEGTWQEVPCSDITVHRGICTTESWNGYGNLLKTDENGVLSIGLPSLPGAACRYGFIAGKPGYLNMDMHEDWTKVKTTRRQGENGEGTYEFEFTLRFITEEDKFIVHTRGFEGEDLVHCEEAYAWSKCLLHAVGSIPIIKKPDKYPDGKVEFTKADGLKEGHTYGIGPRITQGILPTGPVWCGKFEGTKDIYLYSRYGIFGEACELMGIPKDSDECRRFWADMADPVFVADVISGIFTGKDVYGAEYHPGAFEIAMLPVVIVCSLLPMVPGGNITKYLGKVIRKGSKYGDDVAAVRHFIEEDPQRFYITLVYGDEPRLNSWIKAIADGDIEKARGLGEEILANPAIKDSEAISKFNQWLDELEKQIDNIDPAHPDYAKVVADIRDNVREAAGELLAYIGDDDLVRGSGERLAKLLNDNWDGAFKLARRAKPKYHFFESFEIVKYGKALDGTPMRPAMHDYALVLTAFNKANKLGKFSKTGLLLSEVAAYSEEAIRKTVFEAFSEERFWHFWRVARPESKEKYIKHLVKGELAEASVMLDDAYAFRIRARDVSDYADEIDDALVYIDIERLDNMIEVAPSHQTYREALEELSLFPDEYARILDEAYPAYIHTLRYGDIEKNLVVFIKATDAVCSPRSIHCMFTGLYLPMYIAETLEQLPRTHVTDWATKIAKAYKKYPQVRTYLKNNRALINEAMMKGELSKIDEFVDILFNTGDTSLAHSKLQEAVIGMPPGTITKTSKVVNKTIETLDELNAKAETRRLAFESFDEAISNIWLKSIETEDKLYRALRDEFVPMMNLAERASKESNLLAFKKIGTKWGKWVPSKWHGKVAALGAEGKLTIGGETIDLRRLLIALYDQGITSEDKPLFNSIFRALAHAREKDLRELRIALDNKNYDSVIRKLNDLPHVDMNPSLIVDAFNKRNEKLLQNFVDKYIEITRNSGFNLEEIVEFHRLAEEKIDWYRFVRTDNYLENFFYNTLTNLRRGGEHITQAGADTIVALGVNNPRVMLEAISKIDPEDFRALTYELSRQGYKNQAAFLRKFDDVARTPASEWPEKIASKSEWCEMSLREWAESLGFTETALKGDPQDVAEILIEEFPNLSASRIVNEVRLLTPEFKAADGGLHWRAVREEAIKQLMKKRSGLKRPWAAYIIDKQPSTLIKEIIRAIPRIPWYSWVGITGLLSAWYYTSGTQGWSIEEMPQTFYMDFQNAYKEKDYAECERILAELKIQLEEYEKIIPFLMPPWHGMARRWLEMHKVSFENKMYLIGLGKKPGLEEEAYITHVRDIIDGDTIATGLTEEDLEARADYFEKWLEEAAAGVHPAGMDFPLYAIVRLAGYNAPDEKAVPGTYESCRIEVVGGDKICRDVTKWAYNESTNWLHETLNGRDVTLYIDPADQYDRHRRILAVIYLKSENICVKAVRNGVGEISFYRPNKYVDVDAFKQAEEEAKANKRIVWNPKAYICPATGAWFSYYSGARESVRVGTPTTFEGHAKGCDDSEITDWEWTFPHDVKKTGRVVTHTFTEAGSYEIHLKICAGAIDEHRTVTVSRAYGYRESPCGNYGNVNNDPNNYVTDEDAKLVMDYVELGWDAVKDKVGGLSESEFKERADVDNDGEVTHNDADLIYEYYAGSDTGVNTFPVCPGAPPGVHHVKIIGPTTVTVGETVTLTGMAYTEAPYKIVSWTWTITDPDGAVTTKTGKTITLTFNKVGVWGIRLEACNDATPPNCGTTTQKITVSTPKPPEGELTVATYDTITFTTPRDVATFFIDGVDKGGGYAVTAKLPAGSHTVAIAGKEGEYDKCYVNILDKCCAPFCTFTVDVKANETTVAKVCRAAYIYLSAYSGSDGYDITAKFYYKPYDIPNATYKEIATGGLIPFGRHYIKAVASGYETLEMIISVSDSGIKCEYAMSSGAVCYGSAPSTPGAHGLYSRNFIVKMYLKKAAVTKTVKFESVPGDATIEVLD